MSQLQAILATFGGKNIGWIFRKNTLYNHQKHKSYAIDKTLKPLKHLGNEQMKGT